MVSKPVLDLWTCLKWRCIWSISGIIQHSLVLFPQFWCCAFSRWPEVYSGFNQYFKTAPCRGWNGEQNSDWRYRFQAFEYQMGTMESGDNPSGFLIYKWPLFSYIITWSIVEAHKQQQLQLQLIASGRNGLLLRNSSAGLTVWMLLAALRWRCLFWNCTWIVLSTRCWQTRYHPRWSNTDVMSLLFSIRMKTILPENHKFRFQQILTDMGRRTPQSTGCDPRVEPSLRASWDLVALHTTLGVPAALIISYSHRWVLH